MFGRKSFEMTAEELDLDPKLLARGGQLFSVGKSRLRRALELFAIYSVGMGVGFVLGWWWGQT